MQIKEKSLVNKAQFEMFYKYSIINHRIDL